MTDNFINDFIKEYQKQPCLWQASCSDFKNRKKRQDAYVKLIEVASKHGESYNIERTKQKINNLRCAFRVQLKKYRDSKNNPKNGKEEQAYCPKRKYMESLMFLINEETKPVRRKSTTNDAEDNCQLIKRRNIDKELDALTMSLESESEDNIEQNNDILVETIETTEEQDSNNINIKNNIISNEKLLENELEDQQQQISIKNDEQQNIGEILWTNESVVSEIKTPTKTSPPQQNITIRPNLQTRVVHVRTVKQATQPVRQQQEPQIIPAKKKINNNITNNPSIIKPIQQQKLRRLSAVNVPVSVQVSSPPEKNNFQRLISTNNLSNTLVPIVSIPSPQLTTPSSIMSSQAPPPAAIIVTTNNTDIKSTNNTVSSTCETINNKNDSNNFEKLLSLACTRINQIADSEDEYGIFGKMVTCKLRRMDPDQALIAQKQITNILFDGQMKLLQLSGCNTQKQISNSSVPQQLHSTTIRPIRNNSVTGQSFFISSADLNGNSINDEQSIHFNTLTGETQLLGK